MNRAFQLAPWLVSTVLAITFSSSWIKFNDQLQQKDTQINVLREELNTANIEAAKKLSEAEKKYNALSSEASNKLKELATTASQQIEQANLPEVQARVTFRKAMLSSGQVAKIANLSNRTIAINVLIGRPGTGKTISRELILDANQYKEVGEMEGWAFIPDDTVTITQHMHKARTFKAE